MYLKAVIQIMCYISVVMSGGKKKVCPKKIRLTGFMNILIETTEVAAVFHVLDPESGFSLFTLIYEGW